jgi:hypothetical protein
MAIKVYVGDKYTGLSTDIKPSEVVTGATFYEIDTLLVYLYDGTSWKEVLFRGEIKPPN